MLRLRLNRHDWLGEMQVMVGVGLAVCGVIGAVRVALLFSGAPVYAELPQTAIGEMDTTGGSLRPGVRLDPESWLPVRVDDPTARQVVVEALTSLPTYLVVVAVLLLLFAMLRSARGSEVFLAGTVRRLRITGLVAVVGGCLAAVVETIARLDLSSSVTDGATATRLDVMAIGLWTLVGFGLLTVAEIVRRGLDLRGELEQVI